MALSNSRNSIPSVIFDGSDTSWDVLYCPHIWYDYSLYNALYKNTGNTMIKHCYICKGKIRKYRIKTDFQPHIHSTPNGKINNSTNDHSSNILGDSNIRNTIPLSYKQRNDSDSLNSQPLQSISLQVDNNRRKYVSEGTQDTTSRGRLRKSLKSIGCIVNLALSDKSMKKRTQIQACSILVMIVAIVIISFVLVNITSLNNRKVINNLTNENVVPTKMSYSNETSAIANNIIKTNNKIDTSYKNENTIPTITEDDIVSSTRVPYYIAKILKNVKTYPKNETTDTVRKQFYGEPKDKNNRDISLKFCKCQNDEVCLLDESSGTSVCKKTVDPNDPTVNKMKVSKEKILRYPDSAMQSAIKAVREEGLKIREASRQYGVPHSTLINKLKGRVPEIRKMGPDTYLTSSEEQLLVEYILANAKKGIPLNKHVLQQTVKQILDKENRNTPFKCNKPGKKWISLFMKRHPNLTVRSAESISTSRAHVSEEDLRGWYGKVKEYLTQENLLDILDDPTRVFNADESGFQTCPLSGKVLGPAGMKNFYEIKSGKEKEQLTVMVTISASGHVVAPMIVYPLMRISKDIAVNVPDDWAIGKSPKGWMTGPLYYEYIANIFDPWLKSNNIKKPVLLLVDGHRSHMTLQVSEYCAANQIITYALYPNSTHITQPADVSVFKCLKSGWKNTVFEYKQATANKAITRAGFAPLLAKVFKEKVTPDIIKNGFERCGIYPFNPSAVDYTKCMEHTSRTVIPKPSRNNESFGVETILLLESCMRRGRVQQFRECKNEGKDWHGDESAKELFYVWKKFKEHCLHTNESQITSLMSDSSPGREIPDLLTPVPVVEDPVGAISRETTISPTIFQELSVDLHTTEVIQKSPVPIASDLTTEHLLRTPEIIPVPSTSRVTPIIAGRPVPYESVNMANLMKEKHTLISPAFSDCLLWPSDSPIKTKKKERIPLAVTSLQFQEYHTKKQSELQNKLEKIATRKRKREENKKNKNKENNRVGEGTPTREVLKIRRPILYSDTESEDSDAGESLNPNLVNRTEIKKGVYVIVTYEGEYFPGLVEAIDYQKNIFAISTMNFSTGNTFKWPDKKDMIWYEKKDIVEIINDPVLANKRGFYIVKEMAKYLTFTV